MATPHASAPTIPRRSRWPRRLAWLVLAGGALAAAVYGRTLTRQTTLATAYAARVGCACHFVAGRPLGECRADFEPGTELVMLSADSATRTVTARIPLLAAQRASARAGAGCQLEPWRD